MSDILLQEMSNSDIDWMLNAGHKLDLIPDGILFRQGSQLDHVYLLLEGSLSLRLAIAQSGRRALNRAFAALGGEEDTGKEVGRLGNGEVTGESVLYKKDLPTPVTVQAITRSSLLALPLTMLRPKLADVGFGSRFYRMVALMLASRIEAIAGQMGRNIGRIAADQPQLREVLSVFGELHDSDIDWMIAAGETRVLPPGGVLIQAFRPVDALYILIKGSLSVSVSEDEGNALNRAFSALGATSTTPTREIDCLAKGQMVGEMAFLEGRPSAVTIAAKEESFVLTLPRQQLAAKLQLDLDFAVRFYRVLGLLLLDRFQGTINRVGLGRRTYSGDQPLDSRFEDELETEDLDQLSLAGTRFDWMVKRLLQTLS
ncbi:cyclic nucleotide-binding domain-containing protein [Synechococcus sp. Nb3U1]|uniref:cyclic nucleotide-binding domain-containing protein n=1 Tax=Synechococcus sp. Nb3U1 TaxID=1914529 RepID=UPI001F326829|nr:cyclic nucleotide-binding domain-containing protein [Synechococcus sp. Nb3U1]MCF2972527.1 cyclic nucleotide-binding domain-containing protein [Synechococcus sp. Nb3U1]